jgi:signal transduction histidine kinase
MQHTGKLSDVFERLNPREYGEIGVGLAIRQLIVRQYGGSIWTWGADLGASFLLT